MNSHEEQRLKDIGDAPRPGAQAAEALAKALAAARALAPKTDAESTEQEEIKGEEPSPRSPEANEELWEALKAPAAMAREALLRSHPAESEETSALAQLAEQLTPFDWAAWSAGLRGVQEFDRREVSPEELESLLFSLVESAFDSMARDQKALALPTEAHSPEAIKRAQETLRQGAAPRIELAKSMLRGMGAQEWGGNEHSIDKSARQRASEPFVEKTGWPWSEAQAEMLAAAGFWAAEAVDSQSTMLSAWEDRGLGLWPCPLEDVNPGLLRIGFRENAKSARGEDESVFLPAYLLAHASGRRDLAQSLGEITRAAAENGLILAEHPQAFWRTALARIAGTGRLEALAWCADEAKGNGLTDAQLRAAAARGSHGPEEADGAALAMDKFGALAKWINPEGRSERSEEEFDRGMELLLGFFSAEERPAAALLAAAKSIGEMAVCALEDDKNPGEKKADRWEPLRRETARVARRALELGANPDLADEDGNTALMAAAWTKHSALADLLLEAGGDANLQSREGATALAQAGEPAKWPESKIWQATFMAKADACAIRRAMAQAERPNPASAEAPVAQRAPRRV